MVSVEYKQVSQQEDGGNVIKRRVDDYPVVIEVSQKYIGVEKNGEYRVFGPGEVKSIHNETGIITDGDDIFTKHHGLSGTDLPDVLSMFSDEYSIVHGDIRDLD